MTKNQEEQQDETKFICPYCGIEFATIETLEAHKKFCAEKDKPAKKEVEGLNDEAKAIIDELETKIGELEGKTDKIDELETKIGELEADINTLKDIINQAPEETEGENEGNEKQEGQAE